MFYFWSNTRIVQDLVLLSPCAFTEDIYNIFPDKN